ncbi:calcium-binding protein [Geminicoccus flavidas]|uniref:calcium-binding protein n=1 Tax=Geminicoccus flavidas TaxID=2506407 RepID=UPI00135AA91C|nr:hypothetical protein [Geminicoccus flavidas]
MDGGDGDDRMQGGYGNDVVRGGTGDDYIDIKDGDDRVSGGLGDDIIWGRSGDDVLDVNMGDDRLVGGNGHDLLTGGSGNDLFAVYFSDWFLTDRETRVHQADDLILDFARGQDRPQITFSAEGHPATGEGGGEAVVRFRDLDTDGSGVLDGGDAAVSIHAVSHDGETRTSLVIDVAKLPYQSLVATHGTITLFGVTALGAADIDATTPMSAFHPAA